MVTAVKMRELLKDEFDKLINKETTVSIATTAANIVGKMISSAKVQLEYNKMTGRNKSKIGFLEE